jgi:hypothetical protein
MAATTVHTATSFLVRVELPGTRRIEPERAATTQTVEW